MTTAPEISRSPSSSATSPSATLVTHPKAEEAAAKVDRAWQHTGLRQYDLTRETPSLRGRQANKKALEDERNAKISTNVSDWEKTKRSWENAKQTWSLAAKQIGEDKNTLRAESEKKPLDTGLECAVKKLRTKLSTANLRAREAAERMAEAESEIREMTEKSDAAKQKDESFLSNLSCSVSDDEESSGVED